MFDAIVVGARCAGAPISMLLARHGHDVLLVDQARFPSDTISTHLIWHAGLARAKTWGLLDDIEALGAPPIREVSLDLGEFALRGTPPPVDGIHHALAPRRTLLDALLVRKAREAGVVVRERFRVSGLLYDGGRVVGIRGHAAGGSVVDERARVVVGADGCRSVVARLVNAPAYHERPSTATAYYSYWSGAPHSASFDNYVREGAGCAAFPTNDGATCIVAGWNASIEAPTAEAAYMRVITSVPYIVDVVLTGRQIEPLRGFREQPGYFRKPWGDGWALAGDAACHKHPLSAQGISDAFRDADLLTAAIDDVLAGRRDASDALADYERLRMEAMMPMYESTMDRARLAPPPPPLMALFRALRWNQRETDRFFGTDAGTVPITEFFSPESLGRIMQPPPDPGRPGPLRPSA